MMPWNYTNTTAHFRELAERVGSARIKVMWGPADNYNCGEADVAAAGFLNVRPYLHSLHLKDLRVNDGMALDFDYVPLGEGEVDYRSVLRNLIASGCEPVLSLATHFQSEDQSPETAMRINHTNLMALIDEVQGEQPGWPATPQAG